MLRLLKLTRVEPIVVSLTALNIGLYVRFCKASALRQTHASPDIKFVGRNSHGPRKTKIFVQEEADKTQ